MVIVSCPIAGCQYQTDDVEAVIVASLLQLHNSDHASSKVSAPKLDRPTVDAGISQERWNTFVQLWEAYKTGMRVSDGDAPIQLFQCATAEFARLLLQSDRYLTTRSTASVLESMRVLAVIPVARGVVRAELMRMRQANDESFRLFAARVRGKAETCGYSTTTKCSCQQIVTANYTEEAIRDVLLAGISSEEIRREALSAEGLQQKSVNDIIGFVEGREMAGRAITSVVGNVDPSLSSMSTYKRSSNPKFKAEVSNESKSALCPGCGKTYKLFKQFKGGRNKIPFKNCLECWKKGNSKRARARISQNEVLECWEEGNEKPSSQSEVMSLTMATQISAVQGNSPLGHRVFQQGEWRKAKFREHPVVTFKLGMDGGLSGILVKGIADTGAQANLWGFAEYIAAGFLERQLNNVTSRFCAADKRPIGIVGAFDGILEGKSRDGRKTMCRSMVYVSRSVTGFFSVIRYLVRHAGVRFEFSGYWCVSEEPRGVGGDSLWASLPQ